MEKVFLIAIFLLIVSVAPSLGQFTEVIDADSPGLAISANTVGKRTIQLHGFGEFFERGYGDSEYKFLDYAGGPGLLLRVGIIDRLEVGLGTLNWFEKRKSHPTEEPFRTSLFLFRLRGNFVRMKGFRPGVGLHVGVIFPDPSRSWITSDNYSSFIRTKVLALYNQQLGKIIGLRLNLGGDFGPTYAGEYAINLSFRFARWGKAIIEHNGRFGTFVRSDLEAPLKLDGRINGGFAFIPHKNVQIDISGGYLARTQSKIEVWMLNCGVNWRVTFKKRTQGKKVN